MKIWSTKYCLTTGITEHEARVNDDDDMVIIPKTEDDFMAILFGEGKQWHKSLEAAVARANEIKIKKLQSLDKQAKKISAITFD